MNKTSKSRASRKKTAEREGYPARVSPAAENTGRNESADDFTPDFTPDGMGFDSDTSELLSLWSNMAEGDRAILLDEARSLAVKPTDHEHR